MKKSLIKFEIFATLFIFLFGIIGIINHFLYSWSNYNPLIGIFSPINESIWEHLKLIFFPMTLTNLLGSFLFRKEIQNYLSSKTKGTIISLLFIIIFFYTYTGIIGKDIAFLDISSFFIACIIGEYQTYNNIMKRNSKNNLLSSGILLFLFLCFLIFTFYPPRIPLFMDPITKSYGI